MSHVVQITTEVRDVAAIQAACRRLQFPNPEDGTFDLFASKATGWSVRLPDWQYPVVCDVDTGQIRFDNFEGHWGDQKHLDTFLQRYAVEKTRIEARKRGHTVTEQQLTDGTIRLTVQIVGETA